MARGPQRTPGQRTDVVKRGYELAELVFNPDHKKEIIGRAKAQDHRLKQRIRPDLPSVPVDLVLHTPIIQEMFLEWFDPCCEYAYAIDTVARERLRDREAFNRYLMRFDDYLQTLRGFTANQASETEKISNGNFTSMREPFTQELDLRGPREHQFYVVLKNADNVLRAASHAAIFGTISEDSYRDRRFLLLTKMREQYMSLRKVKLKCFRRIAMEREQLGNQHQSVSSDTASEARTVTRTRTTTPKIVQDLGQDNVPVALETVSRKGSSELVQIETQESKTEARAKAS